MKNYTILIESFYGTILEGVAADNQERIKQLSILLSNKDLTDEQRSNIQATLDSYKSQQSNINKDKIIAKPVMKAVDKTPTLGTTSSGVFIHPKETPEQKQAREKAKQLLKQGAI